MLVYKIKGEKGWYGSCSSLEGEEYDSPIFTNRSKAEKRIRSEIANCKAYIERNGDHYPWARDRKEWSNARVVTFKLVEVKGV